jgi:hypothetical protein
MKIKSAVVGVIIASSLGLALSQAAWASNTLSASEVRLLSVSGNTNLQSVDSMEKYNNKDLSHKCTYHYKGKGKGKKIKIKKKSKKM